MASDVQILISAQDRATATLKSVVGRLDEITNKLNSVTGASQQMSESMERASSSLFSFNTSMGKFLVNSLYFTAMGAAIQGMTEAIHGAVDAMLGFNARQEQTALGFETLIGSAEASKTLMADLQNLADFSPFQYKELTTSARNLLAFGEAARDVIPDLTSIGNVVSGLGLGEDGLNHIVMALGKLGLETKASAKEIRQLNAWGINAQKYLQQELGLTAEQISKIKDAGVTGQEAMRAIISGMSKDPMFAGMMEKQSKTILGLLATLKDQSLTIFSTIGSVMTQPINDALASLVEKSTQLTRTLRNKGGKGLFEETDKMDDNGNPTGEKDAPLLPENWQNSLGVAYNAVSAFWEKCKEAFSAIGQLISDIFGGDGTGAFEAFVVALARVGMAAASIVTGLAQAGSAIVNLISTYSALQAIVVGVTAGLLAYNATLAVITAVTGTYAALKGALAAIELAYSSAVIIMSLAVSEYGLVQGVVNGIVLMFDAALIPVEATALLVAAAVAILAAAGYLIYDNWGSIGPFFSDMWDGICSLFGSAIDWVVEALDSGLIGGALGIAWMFGKSLIEQFFGVSINVKELFSDMANAICSTFSWLLNKVLEIMGPLGTAIKGLGEAVGTSVGGAWDSLTGSLSWGMDGIKDFASRMQGLAQVTPAGREAIQAHQPWRMDEGDGSGGKEKNGRKEHDGTKAYENASDKILQLQDDLQAKIEALEGTTYDSNIHKLQKEIDKINSQMRKAAEAGVDEETLNKVAALRDKYAAAQVAKLNRDLDREQRKFLAESTELEAKNAGDKAKIAESVRDKALVELEKQVEDWHKAGIKEEEIVRRSAAQKLAIEKAYTTAVEDAEIERLNWRIQHNENLVILEGKTKQEIEDINQGLYLQQADTYRRILADARSTAEERAKAEKDLATVIEKVHQDARHHVETAWDEAYTEIKNKQTDYASIIVETFDSMDKTITGAFEDWFTGTKSFTESFKSMIYDMTREVIKMFVDMWVQSAIMTPLKNSMQSLFGSFAGVKTGGGGSSVSSSLFSGAARGLSLGFFGGSKPGFFASGGLANGWSVVGEEGPELVNFSNPGRVYSSRDSAEMMGGRSSGREYNGPQIVMHVHANDAQSFKQSKGQILGDLGSAMRRAGRNM